MSEPKTVCELAGCDKPVSREEFGKYASVAFCAGHWEVVRREKLGERFSQSEIWRIVDAAASGLLGKERTE